MRIRHTNFISQRREGKLGNLGGRLPSSERASIHVLITGFLGRPEGGGIFSGGNYPLAPKENVSDYIPLRRQEKKATMLICANFYGLHIYTCFVLYTNLLTS